MHRRLHLFIREPVGHNDSDSTSGCSADMSNADSGRGPSEDGEFSRNGGKWHLGSHSLVDIIDKIKILNITPYNMWVLL